MALVTLVVILLVGVLLIVGSLILSGGAEQRCAMPRDGRERGDSSIHELICREPHCGCRNDPGARFCARCGAALTSGGDARRE